MSSWEKWLTRPQTLWLRRALFQVHLWTGIGVGLYVLSMSVSGTVLIYRRQLAKELSHETHIAAGPGARMTVDELKQVAREDYPEYETTRIYERQNLDEPVEILLERGPKKLQRLFNPYTGADLGDPLRPGFRFILWLADLHDNLLHGKAGLRWNAAGAIFTILLCLTGLIIWWPGIKHWRSSLTVGNEENPKGLNWALHSALGFWSLAFIVMWGISGLYLSIPESFNAVVDFLEPVPQSSKTTRFGDQVLFWLSRLHFGRFAGVPVEIIWTIFGLMPALLFVTGTLMWWKRVLRRWMRRRIIDEAETQSADNSLGA
ncbi:MAG: PepSY-associated helix domain protein [Candidatus Acidoferrum typicum]|nr:PepSY-associated helix domain protein [Candidatus Acidoferrum typicum]